METRAKSISIQQMLEWKKQLNLVKPMAGLDIQNITIPSHLATNKIGTDDRFSITIPIRGLFNSLTDNNILQVKEQLRQVVISETKSVDSISEIAEEMFQQFIISDKNIKNYMHLLNSIHNASVLINDPQTNNSNKSEVGTKPKVSKTIGYIFLNKCRDFIFAKIKEDNIRSIAQLNQDDINELDKYTKALDEIINAILTICYLYSQRQTTNIKLTATQVFPVMRAILDTYIKSLNTMRELGNPYEEECSDEDEYIILSQMCSIYARLLYSFIKQSGSVFCQDPTLVKIKSQEKEQTLKDLITEFKEKIIPTLTESYLISQCQDLDI
jgi:hypothetical protein